MSKRIINTEKAPAAIGPYSQAVLAGDVLYTSGQIPLDPKTGAVAGPSIEEQTLQVLKNIQGILEAAGTDPDHVVKTTCFLSDMKDFDAFNKMYGEYFTSCPARSCVAVKALPKGVLVEIEAIVKL